MRIQLSHTLEDIASVENIIEAWKEFLPGKKSKPDVQEFQMCLMDNILSLHADLMHGTYRHGGYHAFAINDPKPRNIHKASVRDRLIHHAIYRILYPFFDRTFIADSFSCRVGKGTHKALNRFRALSRIVSKNNTRTCWGLKCDIKKFFANIDHKILISILVRSIPDERVLGILKEIVSSFSSTAPGVGLPLGNLTSQLFANMYMNECDQFAKHRLNAQYYIRYADDFVMLSHDRAWLESIMPQIEAFLRDRLRLRLHPDKVFIKTLASGVDFLGWVHFPDHRVLRTSTKRRMMKKIQERPVPEIIASYKGLLRHGNARKLEANLTTKNFLTL